MLTDPSGSFKCEHLVSFLWLSLAGALGKKELKTWGSSLTARIQCDVPVPEGGLGRFREGRDSGLLHSSEARRSKS